MIIAETAPSFEEHVFIPDAGTARSYRNALGAFPTGVAVVTANTDAGPIGMTINSFASISLDPPLVLWSPAKSSSRRALFTSAWHFTIHMLSSEQTALGLRFTSGGQGFADLGWERNTEGSPIIPGTLARFECEQESVYDAGDHSLVIGLVLRVGMRDGEPLCFARGDFGRFERHS